MNSATQNFAAALNNVARTVASRNRHGVAEMTAVKLEGWPKSDWTTWNRQLNAAIKAGLVATLADKDCTFVLPG